MSGEQIVWNTAQSVANVIAGRMVASGWKAAARNKHGRRNESPGGSAEQRFLAYSELRRSVIEFRTSLATLVASRPRMVGGFWSVPLYLRMMHRVPDLSSALLDHLLAVHTVGRFPVIEAANTMLSRLASAADVYVQTSGDRPRRQESKMDIELAKVDDALADFTAAVRGDLGFGDLPAQSGSASVRQPGQG